MLSPVAFFSTVSFVTSGWLLVVIQHRLDRFHPLRLLTFIDCAYSLLIAVQMGTASAGHPWPRSGSRACVACASAATAAEIGAVAASGALALRLRHLLRWPSAQRFDRIACSVVLTCALVFAAPAQGGTRGFGASRNWCWIDASSLAHVLFLCFLFVSLLLLPLSYYSVARRLHGVPEFAALRALVLCCAGRYLLAWALPYATSLLVNSSLFLPLVGRLQNDDDAARHAWHYIGMFEEVGDVL
jgi:hypothetical protein